MNPFGSDQPASDFRGLGQRLPQTLMRAGEVVERLVEHDAPPHLLPILAEAPALAHQGSQGMAQRQVQTLDQTRADGVTPLLQTRGSPQDPLRERLEAALLFVLDDLRIDQVGMRLLERVLRTPPLAGPRKLDQGMVTNGGSFRD